MNIELFREYCLQKAAVEECTPFGPDTLVFKVHGKMFALCDLVSFKRINLKCMPQKAIELRELHPEVSEAYHMNKKHWISVDPNGQLSNKLVSSLIDDSYQLVVASLPKKIKAAIENAERSH